MPNPSCSQDSIFTTRLPADDYLWTAGFFNERFPDVVSPLGWSVVRRLIEPTALREPLSFLGYDLPEDFPLSKTYHGHVYTNVAAFQRLYRVFPGFVLPEDAGRYFPGGDVSLRYQVPLPSPLRFSASAVRTLLTEPGWYPLNFVTWDKFAASFDGRVVEISRSMENDSRPAPLLHLVERLMDLSLDLLRLHRWSLTYAGVLYGLLQRLLSTWIDADRFAEIGADLISGLPNKSTETDLALWRLARQAADLGDRKVQLLRDERFDAFFSALDEAPAGRRFQQTLDDFLTQYGHRSPSLDIRYPAYADDPARVLAVLVRLLDAEGDPAARGRAQRERRREAVRQVEHALRRSPLRKLTFRLLLWLTQRYTVLREDQRFYWQKSMHAKRWVFLRIGRLLSDADFLHAQDDIFFLTLSEVTGVVRGWLDVPGMRRLIANRRAQFEDLQSSPYPAFLEGQVPLGDIGGTGDGRRRRLTGLAASPGRARGPALIVSGPAALEDAWQRVSADHILVVSSTDPAWTPLFLRVSALVMERGGQLSHGAVVAREYGLPAVVGVAGALDRIADGQLIEVDGQAGIVALLT
ncbi:MAG: Chondramide synthase cmdD [Anaerolineales bacterium]|nr:Chondramide synthase cmdD [Anaerolineales bacterium]